MHIPTFQDVLAAQRRIRPYLARTPLHSYPALNDLLGTEVYVKHENYQPVGAFKVRGGVNLLAQLSPEERERGVIAASTGNHGQSVAYAARLFGVPARTPRASSSCARSCACPSRPIRPRSARCAGWAPRSSSTGATSTRRARTPPASRPSTATVTSTRATSRI